MYLLHRIYVSPWKQFINTALESLTNASGELLQLRLESGSNYEFVLSTCYGDCSFVLNAMLQ
jgi:hypothetical protein